MNIGNWIRRRGKWHLVESLVAEDAITRCGRRMDRVTPFGGELQVSDVMPLTRMIGQPQLCRGGCQLADPAPDPTISTAMDSEDDPSSSPVDPVTGMP